MFCAVPFSFLFGFISKQTHKKKNNFQTQNILNPFSFFFCSVLRLEKIKNETNETYF